MENEYLMFDSETDNFVASVLHCLVITNLITREQTCYGPDQVMEAGKRLSKAAMIAGHYIKGFDIKVVEKFTGVEIDRSRALDTLELSKAIFPEMRQHKLAVWGAALGLPKLPQPIFETFTPEMMVYCARDVDVNVMMFDQLAEVVFEMDEIPKRFAIMAKYRDAILEYID